MSYAHGIVAGKFYPLHRGHQRLLDEATRLSERLTVLLIYKLNETPNKAQREAWLKLAYPEARIIPTIDIFTDDNDPASSIQWANYARDILDGDEVDVVFSSEEYGERWATALGCEHVLVDKYRSYMPISGTEIRNDPYDNWAFIADVAKPFYVKNVLLVGAESVGKTTLCKKLAQKFNTLLVPEYGRIYVERKGSSESSDHHLIFAEIINRTLEMRQDFSFKANRVLFHDTDFLTSYMWYKEWGNNTQDGLGQALWAQGIEDANNLFDLVLVLDHQGTTFVDDGFREQNAGTREMFTKTLSDYHMDQGFNTKVLTGTYDERTRQAIKHVNDLFKSEKA